MPRRNARASKQRMKSNSRAHGFVEAARPTGHTRYETPIETIIVPTGKCGRKLVFATEKAAAAALKEARKSNRNPKYVEKRYYPCPRCGNWHLTSMGGKPNGSS